MIEVRVTKFKAMKWTLFFASLLLFFAHGSWIDPTFLKMGRASLPPSPLLLLLVKYLLTPSMAYLFFKNVRLLWNNLFLRIHENGLERFLSSAPVCYAWEDIANISLVEIGRVPMICFSVRRGREKPGMLGIFKMREIFVPLSFLNVPPKDFLAQLGRFPKAQHLIARKSA